MRNILNLNKLICLILALVLAIGALSACSGGDDDKTPDSSKNDQTSSTTDTDADTDADLDIEVEPEDGASGEDTADNSVVEGGNNIADDDWEEADIDVYNYTVSNKKPIIESYRGMSATVWHAYGFMKDDKTGRVYTDEMMKMELDRLQRMGVHTCRTKLNSQWVWSDTLNNWDMDAKRLNYFFDYCTELQRRGMNIILNLGWDVEFSIEIIKGGKDAQAEAKYLDGRGPDVNGESVGYDMSGKDEYWTRVTKSGLRYADLYAKVITEARSRGINNIDYLLYFTEPSNRKVDGSYHPEGAGPSAEYYTKLCRIISDALDKTGVVGNIQSIGACQGGANDGLLRYVLEHDPHLFDIMGSHHYPTADDITNNVYYEVADDLWYKYMDAMTTAGFFGKKEFWCDEYAANQYGNTRGEPDTDPWNGLQAVVGLMASARRGISNTISWQAVDQLWTDSIYNEGEFRDGIHMCGALPSLFNSVIPRGEYYMWGLFSRYNGYQNGKVYYVDYIEEDKYIYSGLHISVTELEDGNWTINVANVGMEDVGFIMNFDKAINKTLYRHTQGTGDNSYKPDANALIADVDLVFKNVGDKLGDVIPGGTLRVYTSLRGE